MIAVLTLGSKISSDLYYGVPRFAYMYFHQMNIRSTIMFTLKVLLEVTLRRKKQEDGTLRAAMKPE